MLQTLGENTRTSNENQVRCTNFKMACVERGRWTVDTVLVHHFRHCKIQSIDYEVYYYINFPVSIRLLISFQTDTSS